MAGRVDGVLVACCPGMTTRLSIKARLDVRAEDSVKVGPLKLTRHSNILSGWDGVGPR